MNNLISRHRERPPFSKKRAGLLGLLLAAYLTCLVLAVPFVEPVQAQSLPRPGGTAFAAGNDLHQSPGEYDFVEMDLFGIDAGHYLGSLAYSDGSLYGVVGTNNAQLLQISAYTGEITARIDLPTGFSAITTQSGLIVLPGGKFGHFQFSGGQLGYRLWTLSADGSSVSESNVSTHTLGNISGFTSVTARLGLGAAQLGDDIYVAYSFLGSSTLGDSRYAIQPFQVNAQGALATPDLSDMIALPSGALVTSNIYNTIIVGMDVVDGRIAVLTKGRSSGPSKRYGRLSLLDPDEDFLVVAEDEADGATTGFTFLGLPLDRIESFAYAADIEPPSAPGGDFAQARIRGWRISTQEDALTGETDVVMRWTPLSGADGYDVQVLDNGSSESTHRLSQSEFVQQARTFRVSRMPGGLLDPQAQDGDVLRYVTVQAQAYQVNDDGDYEYSLPTKSQHVSFIDYAVDSPEDVDLDGGDDLSGFTAAIQAVVDTTGMDVAASSLMIPIWFALSAGCAAAVGWVASGGGWSGGGMIAAGLVFVPMWSVVGPSLLGIPIVMAVAPAMVLALAGAWVAKGTFT